MMKVLGYIINKKNNLDNHLLSIMSKMTSTYLKIKDALPLMSKRNRKIVLESKIKGQLRLTLPLTINQSQRIKKRTEVLIMKVNKKQYKHTYTNSDRNRDTKTQ